LVIASAEISCERRITDTACANAQALPTRLPLVSCISLFGGTTKGRLIPRILHDATLDDPDLGRTISPVCDPRLDDQSSHEECTSGCSAGQAEDISGEKADSTHVRREKTLKAQRQTPGHTERSNGGHHACDAHRKRDPSDATYHYPDKNAQDSRKEHCEEKPHHRE
jgi:hypothetical protein